MILHDFECPSGHVTELSVESGTASVACPKCGSPAERVYLTPPKLDWLGMAQGANAGPEFIDRFAKVHERETRRQERILREHGDYGPGYAPPPSATQSSP